MPSRPKVALSVSSPGPEGSGRQVNPVLQAFPIRRPASRQKDETTDLIGLLRRRVPRGADEPIEPSAIKLFPCQENLRYLRGIVNVREGIGVEQYEVGEFARGY